MPSLRGFVVFFAVTLLCRGQQAVQVVATLETGSQAGLTIPFALAYDPAAVEAQGESVVPVQPTGAGLQSLRRAEAVFQDGVLKNIRLFLRLEDARSPIHNIVLGAAGPGNLGYVDQTGGVGTGSFRLVTLPTPRDGSVTHLITNPQLSSPWHDAQPNPANAPLVIFAPQTSGANPLNLVHPSAAPGLLVVDPAPLTLTLPPPPPFK